MSSNSASEILHGRAHGIAMALTWLPESAIDGLDIQTDIDEEQTALEAIGSAFALDLMCVPAAAPWAAAAVGSLRGRGIEGCWIVDGVLSRVAARMGWIEALRLSASRPGELAVMLDEALHEALSDVRAGASAGASAVMIADELAGASGWLVSPDFVLEALIPCYRRLAVETRDNDLPLVFHSDGDFRAVLTPLKRAGVCAVHFGSSGASTLEGSVLAARQTGLCPMGGIDVRGLVEHGARKSGELAARLGRGGDLVIADDGGITGAEELAAYGAALGVARDVLGQEDSS